MTRMQVSIADHPALALLPAKPTQLQIDEFGRYLQSIEGIDKPVDLHTLSFQADGLYGRSVDVKAETFIVGLAHKQSGFAVCIGDMTVWTTKGCHRYTGNHIVQTEAGSMRIGFAHADTTWFTVHANKTGGTDVGAIEDSLVEHPERLQTRRNLLKVAA